jgi:hypothetical protein
MAGKPLFGSSISSSASDTPFELSTRLVMGSLKAIV